jgi:predicted acyltransferase
MMPKERLISVDAFRGLTIASMILVNNPASWSFVYPPLRHAEWHGWTPTDLVFPFFLFIVGISLALSFSRRKEEGRSLSSLYGKVIQRSATIFAIGLFLHLFPRFHFSTMRIPGVLQRIAVCFLFGALIYLNTKVKSRIGLSVSFLVGFWALMTFVPVPGYGPGVLNYKGNLCGYIDTKLLAGHIYKPEFDPEGILSTLPAIVTVLIGTLAGDWLRSNRAVCGKMLGIFFAGIILTAAGLLLHPYFPINKQLWTSTFVIFTAGAALIVFGVCYILIESLSLKKWANPFLVLGTNAIAVFAGSTLMVKILLLIKIPDAGKTVSPITYLYKHVLSPVAGPYLGSLIYPLLLIALWVLIILPLYKRKIFIKI